MEKFLVCRWERDSIRALLDQGIDVVLLIDAWEAENRALDQEILDRVERWITVPSFDAMDQLSILASGLVEEGVVIDRVLAVEERGQLGAGYLAALLDVPGPTVAQSVAVRDKRAMKLTVTAAGVPTARFRTVSSDQARTVAEWSTDVGYPAVVKPVAGMGTTATARVDSATGLHRWLDTNADAGPFLIEEFVAGDEFHVDAVWNDGQAQEFAICRYLRPRIEVDNPTVLNGAVLLPEQHHPDLYARIEKLQLLVNDALKISDGITHTEFFVDPNAKIWFSEIALRCGGGGAMQVHRPRGADLRTIWAQSLAGAARNRLGDGPAPYLGWLLITPTAAGRITREPTEEEIARYPYILDVDRLVGVGDTVRLHSLTAGLIAVIGADSLEQARDRALELSDGLTYDVEPA